MSKVGRNDPCPCGSGKKFKRCCLERVEAEERAERLRAEAERAEAEFDEVDEFVETLEHARAVLEESQIVAQVDRLSEAVLRGIEAGRFDEADSAARQLMAGFPDEPLGSAAPERPPDGRVLDIAPGPADVPIALALTPTRPRPSPRTAPRRP